MSFRKDFSFIDNINFKKLLFQIFPEIYILENNVKGEPDAN